MCGIAGVFGKAPAREREDIVQRMLDSIPHRGPDGEGLWGDADAGITLGHKRLAIIDPEGGAQPLATADGRLQVTFNGCIYNFKELREELEALGHEFRTCSDTEVILHAYDAWGTDCLERFNGMWAFALWDRENRRLFCARDRLGIKPFYYCWDGERFGFASEIKALFAGGLIRPERDEDGFRQYLTFQFCLGERTMFRGVRKLEPGHMIVLQAGDAPSPSRYWDVTYSESDPRDEDSWVEALRELLESSIRFRLRSDVPLGAHLSGGLDSSAVATLAKRFLGDTEVKTFTGAFHEGEAFDETRYARCVAESAGTHYLERYFRANHFADSIEKILWHMDEPAMGPGVFPQYWISQLASEHVKVVLGGQGGDELFMGYARYLVAYLEECLKGVTHDGPRRESYADLLGNMAPHLLTLEQYVPMIRNFWAEGVFQAPARRYHRLMNRLVDAKRLLHPDLQVDEEKTLAEFEAIFDRFPDASNLNRIAYFDMKTHLQGLLHVEDRTSMAASLESRVPILDHRLVELVARIPTRVKVRDGKLKYLYRKVVDDVLPREIMDRTDKKGFPVPIADWMRGELREFVGDILLGERSRARGIFDLPAVETKIESANPFSRALWGALCVEIWHRQFLDG